MKTILSVLIAGILYSPMVNAARFIFAKDTIVLTEIRKPIENLPEIYDCETLGYRIQNKLLRHEVVSDLYIKLVPLGKSARKVFVSYILGQSHRKRWFGNWFETPYGSRRLLDCVGMYVSKEHGGIVFQFFHDLYGNQEIIDMNLLAIEK